jgi:hypothetical protein
MYAFPQPQTRRRPLGRMRGYLRGGRLRGLGMNPHQSGPSNRGDYLLWRNGPFPNPPVVVRPPIRIIGQGPIPPQFNPPPTTGGSASTAGTPVPAGFSQNQIFVASNGLQWIYSAPQGKWISVGTPYNVNAPGTPASTPTSTASGYYTNTPVPLSWPTNQVFTDVNGNQWAYNAGYGTFQMTSSVFQSSALSTSSGVPAGTSTNAPYTDASGNTWVYNPSTGQWTISSAAAASPYTSVLTWLSQATLLSPIPNWALVAGLGFVALKFSQSSGARR